MRASEWEEKGSRARPDPPVRPSVGPWVRGARLAEHVQVLGLLEEDVALEEVFVEGVDGGADAAVAVGPLALEARGRGAGRSGGRAAGRGGAGHWGGRREAGGRRAREGRGAPR